MPSAADPRRKPLLRHTRAFILGLPWAVGTLPVPSGGTSRSPLAEGKLRHGCNMVSLKSHQNRADTIKSLLCPGPCPGTYVDCHISSHKSPARKALWPLALFYRKVGHWQLFTALKLDTERSRKKVHNPRFKANRKSFIHSFIHSTPTEPVMYQTHSRH